VETFEDCLRAQRGYGPCFECGKPATWRHHVVPQSRGGTKTVQLCGRCHGLVHDTARSDDLARLTRDALKALRAKGKPTGRPAVADMPELASRIAALRMNGITLQAIADTLNREHVPTMRGGTCWRPSSVQSAAGYRRARARHQPALAPG
jgi:hypothetical protein